MPTVSYKAYYESYGEKAIQLCTDWLTDLKSTHLHDAFKNVIQSLKMNLKLIRLMEKESLPRR